VLIEDASFGDGVLTPYRRQEFRPHQEQFRSSPHQMQVVELGQRCKDLLEFDLDEQRLPSSCLPARVDAELVELEERCKDLEFELDEQRLLSSCLPARVSPRAESFEWEERCRDLELELNEQRLLSSRLQARVSSESARAESAYREKVASDQLVAELDSRLMELMLTTSQFEMERRETQSHASQAEEMYAQHQAAFQSHLWRLRQDNSEIVERFRQVEASSEMHLDFMRQQIVDTQAQWIEAEADKHVARTELWAVQSELTEERERSLCCVCLDHPRCVVLQPCWHYALCETCAQFVSCCPICRQNVLQYNRIICA
jgi:hypothetical protein